MARALSVTINDLRKAVESQLGSAHKCVTIPVGRLFPQPTHHVVQAELRSKGYEATYRGKGNGTFLCIKKRIAFAT
jgi:hypothetical protein